MAPTTQIYTGFWINHSRSVLPGATLTLTDRDSAFLLALLAVVVTTAGHSFWRILSYISHQTRSSRGPNEAIFYQQQAVLKNSGSALYAAWKFCRLSYAWRKYSKWWQFGRSHNLFFIVSALVVAAVFAVASIFSSQVTKSAGNEVLIVSPTCGFWTFNASITGEVFQWDLKTLNESITAANYANTCYGTGNGDSPLCDTYIVPEIPWRTNQNASCPFGEGTCLLSPTAAYEMDTGQMDSHDMLGIDAVPSERVTLRKVATCAPLHLAPYVTLANKTLGDGAIDEFLQVDIGEMSGAGNWTYEYDTHASYINIGYDLQTLDSSATYGGAWTPNADFNRTDADVAVFFLAANGVSYIYPNGDPFFGAQDEFNITYGDPKTTVYEYWASKLVTSLGCIDQFQICNPNKVGLDGDGMLCTPLASVGALPNASEHIGLDMIQYATVESIVISLRQSNMFYSVSGRGSGALKAQSTVFTLTQVAQLPDNQWQIELDGWFAISLASLQQYLYEKAVGPTGITVAGGTVNMPTDAFGRAICERQMIRNVSGYQNFSTLGVAIILILGCTMVILGWIIDSVVGWIQRLLFKRNFARLSWISDGFLQLQRLAYEGAGYDHWEACSDDVPIAADGQGEKKLFGGLDIWNPEHPQLVRSPNYVPSPTYQASPHDSVKMGLLAYQSPVTEGYR